MHEQMQTLHSPHLPTNTQPRSHQEPQPQTSFGEPPRADFSTLFERTSVSATKSLLLQQMQLPSAVATARGRLEGDAANMSRTNTPSTRASTTATRSNTTATRPSTTATPSLYASSQYPQQHSAPTPTAVGSISGNRSYYSGTSEGRG
eukprot:CAMPEP_0179464536 /NCGR_PEP_ID=MMETSP0799-20121207/46333_1 /TAXON_ID=46947 /ORGANISM="Geminigera cryophila, Strain CCMP2564" /LENGTH=147 /DNA_ID=CAMNT_0021268379 /DNA_START=173 /DNA_END=613 /DNA_ORIENTATION=+